MEEVSDRNPSEWEHGYEISSLFRRSKGSALAAIVLLALLTIIALSSRSENVTFLYNKRALQFVEDDIPTTLESAEFFNDLRAGLKATGIDEILAGEGPFTLFAPKDEAFMKESDGIDCLLEPGNEALLKEILRYHIMDETFRFTNGVKVVMKTLHGGENGDISVDYDDILRINEKAQEVTFPVAASNGMIYTIDSVLIPPGLEITCPGQNPPAETKAEKGPIFGFEPAYIDYIVISAIIIGCVLIFFFVCWFFGRVSEDRIETVEEAPIVRRPIVTPRRPRIETIRRPIAPPRRPRIERILEPRVLEAPIIYEYNSEKVEEAPPPTIWEKNVWS